MLAILWHDEESAGYTDQIPLTWVVREGQINERVHDVVGPRSGRSKAKCDITVSGARADLDYRAYAKFNGNQGMHLGVLRIEFSDNDRNTVSNVLWKYQGERDFKSYPVTVGYLSVSPQDFEADVAASLLLSSEERRKRLASAPKKPSVIKVVSTSYRRNPDVVAEVLSLAKGACQRCKRPAPFTKASTGEPYLEVHHRRHLADGGDDTVENAIALCPNCHREAHHG
ncbi:MAG: HNH endonuclease [Gammaproteobacteria bacterium]|nr:HNH endonuclease [Gammaproteobacteria bacterium]